MSLRATLSCDADKKKVYIVMNDIRKRGFHGGQTREDVTFTFARIAEDLGYTLTAVPGNGSNGNGGTPMPGGPILRDRPSLSGDSRGSRKQPGPEREA